MSAFPRFRRARPDSKALPAPADGAMREDLDEEEGPGARMSFLEHLDELRRRIVAAAVAIGVGCVVSFAFIGRIYDFVMRPLAEMLPKGSKLIIVEPTEGFVLYLKIALLSGIILASPFVLWQVWLFVAPGLYARERRLVVPFVIFGTVGVVVGAAFSHYLLFPLTWRFLASFSGEYTMFSPRIETTFGLYAKMMLGVAAVFQMPTAVYFLARLGIVTARFLVRQFKYAVLIIFIVAAVITPSGDPMTQTLFAVPMVVLYLISIAVAWIFGKRRAADEAA